MSGGEDRACGRLGAQLTGREESQKRISNPKSGPPGKVPAGPGRGNLNGARWTKVEEECVMKVWHEHSTAETRLTPSAFLSIWDHFRMSPAACELQLGGFPKRTPGALYQRHRQLRNAGWYVDGDRVQTLDRHEPSARCGLPEHRGEFRVNVAGGDGERDESENVMGSNDDVGVDRSANAKVNVGRILGVGREYVQQTDSPHLQVPDSIHGANSDKDVTVLDADQNRTKQIPAKGVSQVWNKKGNRNSDVLTDKQCKTANEKSGESKKNQDLPKESEQKMDALRREFWQVYPKVRINHRERLKFNPQKVSRGEWSCLNACVAKCIANKGSSRRFLEVLDCAVYAAGSVLASRQFAASCRACLELDDWLKKQNAERDGLRRHLNMITDELRRRKAGVAPTKCQRRNWYELQRRFQICGKPIRSENDLMSKCESLKARLELLNSRVSLRMHQAKQAKLKSRSLRQLFELPTSKSLLGSPEAARGYWEGIVGSRKEFERIPELNQWCKEVGSKSKDMHFDSSAVDLKIWQRILTKARPMKAPGPDGIPNVLWKKLVSANMALFKWILGIKRRKLKFPEWLTKGRVVLLPKGGDLTKPENYRPIACLNTMYKLLTSLLASWVRDHLDTYNILPEEQRALVKGTWGCTHAMVIDRMIAEHAKACGRDLHLVWLDFVKAFDSVSQPWIRRSLSAAKVHPNVVRAISDLMRGWCVRYEIVKNGKVRKSPELRVRNGVLQGDSMSPLLFILAVACISSALNKLPRYTVHVPGMEGTFECNHQFFMDDGKCFAESLEGLTLLTNKVRIVSSAIGMSLNPGKCAWANRSVHDDDGDSEAGSMAAIPLVGIRDHYKYLGVEERVDIGFEEAWKRVRGSMVKRFECLVAQDRTWGMTRNSVNQCVAPVAKYLYLNTIAGGPSWITVRDHATELDKELRRVLKVRSGQGKAWCFKNICTNRMYLPASCGGYGLKSISDALLESITYCWCYVQCRNDLEVARYLFGAQARKGIKESISKGFRKLVLKPYNLFDQVVAPPAGGRGVFIDSVYFEDATLAARAIVKLFNAKIVDERLAAWSEMPLAGQVPRSEMLDQKLSWWWMKAANVRRVVFRDCVAAQEGALLAARIYQEGRRFDTQCNRCRTGRLTVQHILTGCPVFRTGLMLERHNNVARVLHRELCRMFELQTTHFSLPVPAVLENDRAKIYFDVPILTRNVRIAEQLVNGKDCFLGLKHNRPDLVVFDKIKGKIHVVEICVCWYENLENQDLIKYHKYATNSEVENELSLVDPNTRTAGFNLRALLGEMHGKIYPNGVSVTPIVIGSCGEVRKSFKERLGEIGISGSRQILRVIEACQLAAIQGSGRLIRAHLCGSDVSVDDAGGSTEHCLD